MTAVGQTATVSPNLVEFSPIPRLTHSAASRVEPLVEHYGPEAPLDITIREIRSAPEPAGVVRVEFQPTLDF